MSVSTVKKDMFGIEWESRNESVDRMFYFYHLTNYEFGEFIISEKAYEAINENDYYKVLSLIYEQKLIDKNSIFSITLLDEKEHLKWKYDNFISLSLEELFYRFPTNSTEKQQRALLNLYNQYPDYGQEIDLICKYDFFVKTQSEMYFFIEAMKRKKLLEANIVEDDDGKDLVYPIKITMEGIVEIEKLNNSAKEKKQVFMVMNSKDIETNIKSIKEFGTRELLEEAINLFKQPNPFASKNAVEKLWDAYERLKTYYIDLDKKDSATKIVNDISGNITEFVTLFNDEFRTLSKIGNEFRIRHHETDKIDITDNRHYDYFFNRCLSLISLAIQYLEKE